MAKTRIYKFREISCAHQLDLPYESKCNRLHGHNYRIEVWVEGPLNKQEMVMDYAHITGIIDKYDHRFLNELFKPTTAENFAGVLHKELKAKAGKAKVIVRVWETKTSFAEAQD